MHNIVPEDMDALFRDGAERYEFEYNPDAWRLMEEKLNRKKRRRKIIWTLFGLIFIITIVGYFATDFAAPDIFEEREPIQERKENTTTIDPFPIETIKLDKVKQQASEQISKPNLVNGLNEYAEDLKGHIPENNNNIKIVNRTVEENENADIFSLLSTADQKPGEFKEVASLEPEHIHNRSQITIDKLIVREKKYLESNEAYQVSIDVDRINIVAEGEEIKNELFLADQYTFTLFANPEWSSVGLFRESKQGWSVGSKLGYRFKSKFEILVGLAFSRKIYKGAGKAYTMSGGWYSDIEPMQMDAKCDVIEIPLSASYYLNGFRSNGFFTEFGISSYMLHSEWYGFEYDDALVRPKEFMEVIKENQNTHLVGVGRIAIGYQKVLSNQTSIQIAPYLHFPLTGIGAGSVNLFSSGVQLAIKFNTQ